MEGGIEEKRRKRHGIENVRCDEEKPNEAARVLLLPEHRSYLQLFMENK